MADHRTHRSSRGPLELPPPIERFIRVDLGKYARCSIRFNASLDLCDVWDVGADDPTRRQRLRGMRCNASRIRDVQQKSVVRPTIDSLVDVAQLLGPHGGVPEKGL